ncbi:MAG TPA: sulfotransferase domain-containing protein, partial [Acidimicrobiales bacterium]|nr:sulfotransferase domain-containing protein [Acidimicrobiales bacterium]
EAALDEDIYVSTSRYAMQAERYLERFPADRLLVITTESLAADTDRTMARVYEFLGVDETVRPSALRKQFGTAEQRRTVVGPARHLRALRGVVPAGVRHAAWRTLSRPVASKSEQPVLDADVRRELTERLRPDLRRLQPLVGGDFDCWGLLDGA